MLCSADRCENLMQCLPAVMTKIVHTSHGPYEGNGSLEHHLNRHQRAEGVCICYWAFCVGRFFGRFSLMQLEGQQQEEFQPSVDFWWLLQMPVDQACLRTF